MLEVKTKGMIHTEGEAAAKAKKVGLWSDKQAVPPWEFRRPRAEK